jgi:hypothetical protein
VVLLLPHEDGYLPFLEKRGIQLEELPDELRVDEETASSTLKRCKRVVETDRAVMLKSTKAFLSFVRAYQAGLMEMSNMGYTGTVYPQTAIFIENISCFFIPQHMKRTSCCLARKHIWEYDY